MKSPTFWSRNRVERLARAAAVAASFSAGWVLRGGAEPGDRKPAETRAGLIPHASRPEAAAALRDFARRPDEELADTRREALRAVGKLNDPATVPPLLDLMQNAPDQAIRNEAVRRLAYLAVLRRILREPEHDYRDMFRRTVDILERGETDPLRLIDRVFDGRDVVWE